MPIHFLKYRADSVCEKEIERRSDLQHQIDVFFRIENFQERKNAQIQIVFTGFFQDFELREKSDSQLLLKIRKEIVMFLNLREKNTN